MTHRSPDPEDSERILIYGPPGAGKSSAGRALCADGQHMFVLDTERSYRRTLKGIDQTRVTICDVNAIAMETEASPWQATLDSLHGCLEEAWDAEYADAQHWWLVVDSFTPLWDWCQTEYVTKIHGTDSNNYFLQRRREMEQAEKMGNPLDGNHDWTYINRMFAEFYNGVFNWPGHVLLTAEGQKLDDRDKADTVRDYGAVGYKPKGQKRIGHIPNTVLLATRRAGVGWVLDTVKDREREEIAGAVVDRDDGGFVDAYLVEVAEWEVDGQIAMPMSARERALARAAGEG